MIDNAKKISKQDHINKAIKNIRKYLAKKNIFDWVFLPVHTSYI
jgi:hypothetical protein